MDPSTSIAGMDSQGNMVFTVVKPVMGIFQVSSEQTNSGGLPVVLGQMQQGGMQHGGGVTTQTQMQIQTPAEEVNQTETPASNSNHVPQVPFAEVTSLLDPNMKSAKAREYSEPDTGWYQTQRWHHTGTTEWDTEGQDRYSDSVKWFNLTLHVEEEKTQYNFDLLEV